MTPEKPAIRVRAPRRGAAPPTPKPSSKNVIRIVLLAGGLLLLIVLIVDLRRMPVRKPFGYVDPSAEMQAVLLGLDGPRYEDPEGLFSIVRPAGWTVFKPPESRPYDVVFRGPSGATISIIATRVEYNELPDLVREIERKEKDAGIRTQSEAIFLLGGPAIRRTAGLVASRVFSVDFVRDRVAHHIMCGAPPELFDRYRPVLMDVVDTYRIGPAAAPPPAPNE